MFISREREKLVHAIVFFCDKTKYCHTMKILKLLNLLDVEHFHQTGRSVTGLEYEAWDKGPVAPELWKELDGEPRPDLREAVAITTHRDPVTRQVTRRDLRPKIQFNKKLFSPREFTIMTRLRMFFQDARGEDMSELSHMRGLPWRTVYAGGKGKGCRIPPELALQADAIDQDEPTIDKEEYEYRKELLQGIV